MFKNFNFIKRLLDNRSIGGCNFVERNLGKDQIFLWGKFLNQKDTKESLSLLEFVLKNSEMLTDNDFKQFVKDKGLIGILQAIQKTYSLLQNKEQDTKEEFNAIKDKIKKRSI